MNERPTWFRVLQVTAGGGLFGGVLCGAIFGSAAELHGLVVGAFIAAVFMLEDRFQRRSQP